MVYRPQSYDVIIVGSGSAGLVAAMRCAAAGLKTIVIEKSHMIGGTTALSAGGIWIPANDCAAANGLFDSEVAALEYIRAAAPTDWAQTEDLLWQRFVKEAPNMLRFVTRHSPLRFALTGQSDRRLELRSRSGAWFLQCR